jgi:hypothetical protein
MISLYLFLYSLSQPPRYLASGRRMIGVTVLLSGALLYSLVGFFFRLRGRK